MALRIKPCPRCNHSYCVKHGKTLVGKQRYRCKKCSKTFINSYKYLAYLPNINASVQSLAKESVGVRGMGRLLRISKTTVLKRILWLSAKLSRPKIPMGKTWEVDEMRTYTQKKGRQRWVVAAYCREERKVFCFNFGTRTTQTLKTVLDSLLLSHPLKVYTDKLNIYKSLLQSALHSVAYRQTNHIERQFLNFRTHIKRFSRRTLSFGKSDRYSIAFLKFYLWAG